MPQVEGLLVFAEAQPHLRLFTHRCCDSMILRHLRFSPGE
jgi:hypothetical protein